MKQTPRQQRASASTRYPAAGRGSSGWKRFPISAGAIAADLRQLGIQSPGDLVGRDPYGMYEGFCKLTGQRQDPCLLDTFIAAVRYMQGEPKKPWWKYTKERKRELAARELAK